MPEAAAGPARAVEVIDAGLLTTVQDLGRPGRAHLGVPRSGALDQPAHLLANRLVGNPADAATLETTATGMTLRCTRATTVAVTGAPCRVQVDGRPVAWGAAVTVPAGARLGVGPALAGLRSYLALAGGVLATPVLGSRSTDLLAGLGPAPLRPGDVLRLGDPGPLPDAGDVVAPWRPPEVPTVLTAVPGPRADWCDLARLDGSRWNVAASSNRIGLRLDGTPLARRDGELPSEGMVLGAVQLPPDGRPVVLLNDHASTGGYPVVAVVRRRDLAACAQLRPGDEVRLRVRRPAR